MKKIINIIALIVGLNFFFTGCYTIVWDPREEYPNEENYTESDGFYESDYYGGYGDYYETPWWISSPVFVVYPGGEDNPTTKDRNNGRSSDTENIRNSNGRGNTYVTDRESNITTPVTTTNSGNSTNSNNGNTTTPKRDSNSGNTSSSSSSSDTRNSGSNDTRNSSGSRNSGSGRR